MATKKKSAKKTARSGRKGAAKKARRGGSAKKRGAKKANAKKGVTRAAKKTSKGEVKKGAKGRTGTPKAKRVRGKAMPPIATIKLAAAASPCPPGMKPVEEFFQDENGNTVVRIVCR